MCFNVKLFPKTLLAPFTKVLWWTVFFFMATFLFPQQKRGCQASRNSISCVVALSSNSGHSCLKYYVIKNDYLHCFKKKKASPCMKCCELMCHCEANLFLPWELPPSGNRKFPNGTLPNSQLSECIKLKSSFQSYSLPSLPSSLDSLPYARVSFQYLP